MVGAERMFVVAMVDNQAFGLDIARVRDVLTPRRIAPVPLAPPEIRGLINLRGRIVTVFDLRQRLGLPPREETPFAVTVEQGRELYALLVDQADEVLSVPSSRIEPVPVTVAGHWKRVTDGIVRLDTSLMLVLDIDAVLRLGHDPVPARREAPRLEGPPPAPALPGRDRAA